MKLGPTTTPDDALALAAKLNPDNEPGRLTFITRMGAGKIRDGLPHLIEKVTRRRGRGRRGSATRCTATRSRRRSGYKTRRFDDVIEEVQGFFDVHRALGTWPGGLHVELTGDDVTECVGGGEELDEIDLPPLRVGVRPAAQPGPVARARVPGAEMLRTAADRRVRLVTA